MKEEVRNELWRKIWNEKYFNKESQSKKETKSMPRKGKLVHTENTFILKP